MSLVVAPLQKWSHGAWWGARGCAVSRQGDQGDRLFLENRGNFGKSGEIGEKRRKSGKIGENRENRGKTGKSRKIGDGCVTSYPTS